MGYSIAVKCRDAQSKTLMLRFLKENYREPDKVLGIKDMIASQLSDNLSYDHGKNLIGFDYSSWIVSDERHYIYAVLRWVSLKVGKIKHFKGLLESFPYTVYDGSEYIPCIINSYAGKIPDDYKWEVADAFGFKTIYPSDSPWKDAEVKSLNSRIANSIEEHDRLVLAELKRLDALWTAETQKK